MMWRARAQILGATRTPLDTNMLKSRTTRDLETCVERVHNGVSEITEVGPGWHAEDESCPCPHPDPKAKSPGPQHINMDEN